MITRFWLHRAIAYASNRVEAVFEAPQMAGEETL